MADLKHGKMKAVRWEGKPFSVSVKEIDIPKIKAPLDAIVRLTSSAICGTDLHTYHGRVGMNKPLTFGHENIGIVEEVGNDVTNIKKGDRVVVTAILDDLADNGDLDLVSSLGIGDYGFPQLNGGQAQFMRVPNAEVNLLIVPSGEQHELDYLLLADIWPTAWFCLESAGQVLGDTVVVFGAGPVGLLCAYSALLRGAIRVYSVDHVPERLEKAKSIGAIPINFMESDPVAQIMKLEPNGVDRSCDCIGFECINEEGKNVENTVITWAVNVTKVSGGIGVIGVYINNDLVDPNSPKAHGILPIPWGTLWLKSLSIRGGIVQIRLFQDLLKKLIESGKAKPSFVFTKEFNIDDAPEAFREFSDHKLIKAVFRIDKPKVNGERPHKRARRS